MRYLWKLALPFINVYEGEDPPPTDPPVTDPPPNPGEDDKPKFTQKQLNDIIAKEKGKHQKAVEGQVKELERLKQASGLSEKQKGELQTRIEELQKSVMTKEELALKDREKLQGEHKRTVETLSGERDFFKGLYQKSTITRTIIDEATRADVYAPRQVVALLEGQSRLVEVLDAEGSVVPGEYVVKVKMADTDKEGKPVTLDLTVAEAIKRMQDRPTDFGNLFKSGVSGGLGGSSGKQTKDFDPSKMTPEEYRKWRNSRLGRDKK